MAHRVFIIAAGIAIVATPAIASSSSAGEPKAKSAASTKADTKKYCIEYEKVVGSRVAPVACKTKEQWAREDHVDVDELLRNESR